MRVWLGIAAAVVAADQASKALVLEAFRPGESLPLAPFFNLVLIFNRGAAFSFLADADGWQKWVFAALALAVAVVIAAMLRRPRPKLEALALALIMGGALGNLVDRLRFGAVADFLDFHAFGQHFPAFNVADSALTLGVALMVWQHFREGR